MQKEIKIGQKWLFYWKSGTHEIRNFPSSDDTVLSFSAIFLHNFLPRNPKPYQMNSSNYNCRKSNFKKALSKYTNFSMKKKLI